MHNCQETMKVLSNFRAVFTRRKLFMTLIELIVSNVFQIINQLRLSATVWKLNTRKREEFISSDDLLEPWQLINRSSQQKVDGENEIWNEIKLFVLLNGKCANPRFPSHPVLIKFCLFKRSSLKPCLGRDTKKVLINFNFKLISNEKWGRFIYAFCAIYNFSRPRRKRFEFVCSPFSPGCIGTSIKLKTHPGPRHLGLGYYFRKLSTLNWASEET